MHMFLVLCIILLLFGGYEFYKPIILMHGVNPSYSELPDMANIIKQAHPGTNVTSINAFSSFMTSLRPLWEQTNTIRKEVEQIMAEHPDGVHLLCFSQGGLICRALLQVIPNHNVHNFIALSCPLAGQYGDTDYLSYFFPGMLRNELYKIFYTKFFQSEISVANYWNDPHEQLLYKEYSKFLAYINNQTENPDSHEYKRNFVRMKNLVAIGGPDDGVITPWQSSQFAFYDQNETVIPYSKQKWYIDDSFGLRTLVERSAYHVYEVPGVRHTQWHNNKTVFEKYIEKWLT